MMQGTAKNTMKAVRDLSTDDVLSALGLERRRGTLGYVLPAVGYFAAGLVIGTGVTLLVAPKSGRQMRRELGEKVRHVGDQIGSAAEHLVHDVQGQSSDENDRSKSQKSSVVRRAGASANAES
jgi:hypothetical protein